jgi:hypothetical protein
MGNGGQVTDKPGDIAGSTSKQTLTIREMPEPCLAENEFFRSGNSLLKTLIPDAVPPGF